MRNLTALFACALLAALAIRSGAQDKPQPPQTIFHTADCKNNLEALRVTYKGKRIEGEKLREFVLWLEKDGSVQRECDKFFGEAIK